MCIKRLRKKKRRKTFELLYIHIQLYLYIYLKVYIYITVAPSLQCYDFYTKTIELDGFNQKSLEENGAIYLYWMGIKNLNRNIRIVTWVDKDSSSNTRPDFKSYANVG